MGLPFNIQKKLYLINICKTYDVHNNKSMYIIMYISHKILMFVTKFNIHILRHG